MSYTQAPSATNGQVGDTAPSARGWFNSASGVSATTTYGSRFVPKRDMRVSHLRFTVTTNGSGSDTVDGAIYSADGQTKLASTGTLAAVGSTGPKRIPLTATVDLKAGVTYYVTLSFSAGTQQILGASFGSGFGAELYGTSISTYAVTAQLGTWEGISVAGGTAPATLTGAVRGTGPVVGVSES